MHLWIRGRVQGVFFRASAREEAMRLGLSGWVRNLDHDRVEAVAEGSPEALAAFREWCGVGPAAARVTDVEALEEEPEGLSGFQVRATRP